MYNKIDRGAVPNGFFSLKRLFKKKREREVSLYSCIKQIITPLENKSKTPTAHASRALQRLSDFRTLCDYQKNYLIIP